MMLSKATGKIAARLYSDDDRNIRLHIRKRRGDKSAFRKRNRRGPRLKARLKIAEPDLFREKRMLLQYSAFLLRRAHITSEEFRSNKLHPKVVCDPVLLLKRLARSTTAESIFLSGVPAEYSDK